VKLFLKIVLALGALVVLAIVVVLAARKDARSSASRERS